MDLDKINLSEYENINVDINEFTKAKMKKRLRSEITRRNKKNKFRYITVAAIVVLIIGIVGQPAVAENIPIISNIYEELGFGQQYLPISRYIGESVEDNGIKATVENIAATNNIIRIGIKVEANEEIFEGPEAETVDIETQVNGVSKGSGTVACTVDKKTQMHVINILSPEGFEENNILKLNIYSEKYNINKRMKMKVDLSKVDVESVKKEGTFTLANGQISNIEIDASKLGTIIKLSNYEGNLNDKIELKLDDKIYGNCISAVRHGDVFYMNFDDIIEEELQNVNEIAIVKSIHSTSSGEEYVSEEPIKVQFN